MKQAFHHRATHTFWKLYDNLPKDIRKIADRNFEILRDYPKHPSLHFKHIKGEIWSARVGVRFRAVALAESEGFAWIWIGDHSEYERLIK